MTESGNTGIRTGSFEESVSFSPRPSPQQRQSVLGAPSCGQSQKICAVEDLQNRGDPVLGFAILRSMILVTGATGFVGMNLCMRLEREGVPYRALVRSRAKALERGLPAEKLHVGDLSGDLEAAVEGVEQVLHLAGLVRGSKAELLEVNETGTQRLVSALEAQAPEARLVLLSSLAAAGPSADGSTSAAEPESCRPPSFYGQSKRAGELVLRSSRNPWVVLRPGIVYGPWDQDVLILFKQARRGPGVLSGPAAHYSLIHVEDLVTALLLALDSPVQHEFIPLARDPELLDSNWLRMLGLAQQRRSRVLRLPRIFGLAAAGSAEIFSWFRSNPPAFNLDKYREMRAGSWVIDTQHAKDLLSFEAAIPHEEGFAGTVAWYREQGWLK
jgi:nucleoside-diphosphate-sugar epimerase